MVANEDLNPTAEGARVSISFKAHAGFDAPLINVSGGNVREVKRKLAELTGLSTTGEDGQDLTAFEVLIAAHDLARAAYVAHEALGATVDAEKPSQYGNGGGGYQKRSKPASSSASTPASPSAEDAPKADENPHQDVLDAIAGADSADAVKRVWAKTRGRLKTDVKVNQGWPDEATYEAAKARLAELKAAA